MHLPIQERLLTNVAATDKIYSDKADEYCREESVAVVVLKRLADEIGAKNDVLAVIAGAARNINAGETSITQPGAKVQKTLYHRVLRQAAVRSCITQALRRATVSKQRQYRRFLHLLPSPNALNCSSWALWKPTSVTARWLLVLYLRSKLS